MASPEAVREALAAVLNGVGPPGQGIRASATFVSNVNPPAVVITPQPGANYEPQTFDGAAVYLLRATVLIGLGEDTAVDMLLSSYLASTGQGSLIAAIDASPRLGGACDWCVVQQVRGYGLIEWSGVPYMGAHIYLQAGVSG